MATTAGRLTAGRMLARAWGTRVVASSSAVRRVPPLQAPRTAVNLDLSAARCFATKRKKKRNHNKKAAKAVVDSDSDDSDWEDDQVIPFGQPMIPKETAAEVVEEEEDVPAKSALQEVIDSGLDGLKATSTLIANRKETKKPLFHKGAFGEDTGPTKQQLAEANRVLTVANRCLESYSEKKRSHPLLIQGEPILILHVEVNSNRREATLFWALPFEISMQASEPERMELTQRMQFRLEKEGGGGFLQREVHTVLRAYYPPKLKFKPAPDALLQNMLWGED